MKCNLCGAYTSINYSDSDCVKCLFCMDTEGSKPVSETFRESLEEGTSDLENELVPLAAPEATTGKKG